jgi:hypothetical protein
MDENKRLDIIRERHAKVALVGRGGLLGIGSLDKPIIFI